MVRRENKWCREENKTVRRREQNGAEKRKCTLGPPCLTLLSLDSIIPHPKYFVRMGDVTAFFALSYSLCQAYNILHLL